EHGDLQIAGGVEAGVGRSDRLLLDARLEREQDALLGAERAEQIGHLGSRLVFRVALQARSGRECQRRCQEDEHGYSTRTTTRRLARRRSSTVPCTSRGCVSANARAESCSRGTPLASNSASTLIARWADSSQFEWKWAVRMGTSSVWPSTSTGRPGKE